MLFSHFTMWESTAYFIICKWCFSNNPLLLRYSGVDIGPFKAIEESTLSSLVSPEDRNSILAWYYFLGTTGVASGTMLCGWLTQYLQQSRDYSAVQSYRISFCAYAVMGLIKLFLSLSLSQDSECGARGSSNRTPPKPNSPHETSPLLPGTTSDEEQKPDSSSGARGLAARIANLVPPISKKTQKFMLTFLSIFFIDNLASGLIANSWQTYFLSSKFHLAEGAVGTLFFTTNTLSSISNLFAIPLARRVGLITTMFLGNLPASILIALVPVPSQAPIAMSLLVFRSFFYDLEQAPRQAFFAASVLPEERTAVMGMINIFRTLCQAIGPMITGRLAGAGVLWMAFVARGVLKLVYSVLLVALFYRHQGRDAEQERREAQGTAGEQ